MYLLVFIMEMASIQRLKYLEIPELSRLPDVVRGKCLCHGKTIGGICSQWSGIYTNPHCASCQNSHEARRSQDEGNVSSRVFFLPYFDKILREII